MLYGSNIQKRHILRDAKQALGGPPGGEGGGLFMGQDVFPEQTQMLEKAAATQETEGVEHGQVNYIWKQMSESKCLVRITVCPV